MPFCKKVVVVTRTGIAISIIKGGDVWWEEEIKQVETSGNNYCPAEEMDAEDYLFILYTSCNRQTKRCGAYVFRVYAVDHLYFCKHGTI